MTNYMSSSNADLETIVINVDLLQRDSDAKSKRSRKMRQTLMILLIY